MKRASAFLRHAALLGPGLLLPLAFFPAAEDAYRLPQLLALGLSLGLLALAPWPGSPSKLERAVLCFFGFRVATHVAAGWRADWLAEQALYTAAFVWAARSLGEAGTGRRWLFGLLAGSCLAAIYGLAQSFGLDPLAGQQAPMGFGSRSHATLGNPDFWGGYLVLLLPFALERCATRGKAWWLLGLLLLALASTQTRGAWLAFGVSAAMLLALSPTLPRRRLAGLLLLGAACLGLFLLPQALKRGGLTDLDRGRLMLSRVTWDLALKHPWLGVGGGHFTGAFLREQGLLMQSAAGAAEPYRFTRDAHNDWLQISAESGWVAGLGFMALVAWAIIRARRRPALAAALLAFSVHACFHFPISVVPSAALFWMLMGWAATEPDREPGRDGAAPWLRSAVAVTSVLACLVFGRQLYASALLNRGMVYSLAGRAAEAKAPLLKAASLWPGDERPWMRLGLDADRGDQPVQAERYFLKALDAEPALPEAWADLGLSRAKKGRLDQARKDCLQALALNPRSLEALGNLGKIEYLAGDTEAAIAAFERGLRQDPGWELGRHNLDAILASKTFNTPTKGSGRP